MITITLQDDTEIDLGPVFEGMKAFALIGRLASGADSAPFLQLFAIPQIEGAVVNEGYAKVVKNQAALFMVKYGSRLDDHTTWILTQLATKL